jgi:hypothetical protein
MEGIGGYIVRVINSWFESVAVTGCHVGHKRRCGAYTQPLMKRSSEHCPANRDQYKYTALIRQGTLRWASWGSIQSILLHRLVQSLPSLLYIHTMAAVQG